jgi:hypothetical protein
LSNLLNPIAPLLGVYFSSIPHPKGGRILRLTLPSVIKPGGNRGVTGSLLHLGNIRPVLELGEPSELRHIF